MFSRFKSNGNDFTFRLMTSLAFKFQFNKLVGYMREIGYNFLSPVRNKVNPCPLFDLHGKVNFATDVFEKGYALVHHLIYNIGK